MIETVRDVLAVATIVIIAAIVLYASLFVTGQTRGLDESRELVRARATRLISYGVFLIFAMWTLLGVATRMEIFK